MNRDYLTIGEMCALFDVTPRTLRFYEAKELLFPERNGTQRRFKYRDQVRLKLILRGKRFGFLLEEIRVLLNLYDKNDNQQTQLKETYRLAKIHLQELIDRRVELEEAISDLRAQMCDIVEMLEAMPRGQAVQQNHSIKTRPAYAAMMR